MQTMSRMCFRLGRCLRETTLTWIVKRPNNHLIWHTHTAGRCSPCFHGTGVPSSTIAEHVPCRNAREVHLQRLVIEVGWRKAMASGYPTTFARVLYIQYILIFVFSTRNGSLPEYFLRMEIHKYGGIDLMVFTL